jgi:hypothetical protein
MKKYMKTKSWIVLAVFILGLFSACDMDFVSEAPNTEKEASDDLQAASNTDNPKENSSVEKTGDDLNVTTNTDNPEGNSGIKEPNDDLIGAGNTDNPEKNSGAVDSDVPVTPQEDGQDTEISVQVPWDERDDGSTTPQEIKDPQLPGYASFEEIIESIIKLHPDIVISYTPSGQKQWIYKDGGHFVTITEGSFEQRPEIVQDDGISIPSGFTLFDYTEFSKQRAAWEAGHPVEYTFYQDHMGLSNLINWLAIKVIDNKPVVSWPAVPEAFLYTNTISKLYTALAVFRFDYPDARILIKYNEERHYPLAIQISNFEGYKGGSAYLVRFTVEYANDYSAL